jgi:hypothetical protein
MEEKVAGKGVGNMPLKYACRGLEEGSEGMILPPKYTPTLGGPTNQASKCHHKPKRYVKTSLVCFSCKKIGHKDNNFCHSRRLSGLCKNYF